MKGMARILLHLICADSSAQDCKSFPMWNRELPVVQRVNNLVSRLTPNEEKPQMLNYLCHFRAWYNSL